MPQEEKRLAVAVGRAIAKRRNASHLTQERVAERLGIGVEAMSRIERGLALPTVVRLSELADIFDCNIADLVTETSSRATDQASHLERLLSKLSGDDRSMVVDIVETLTNRLDQRRP
ncbi:DNA-binding protein [Variovorax paradoxus]|jgi:transcriptional regulator with XRE-family HTH domain|uniref:helix-turn-helix domain-containing protein n=1 Tax=Variovorax TaxID=34072 RepID=UPI0006E60263|nr:helix-turn-helix transcriptional regulator [Variovorax sp.]KPV02619.1 DNA-binding protein [Variovorax paradoxus]KPV02654.1 DNA-binding protein [Variovorax paradoxus]KPV18681.1 DNA-binding protein [Variovorax paradoxus]MBS80387.1 XRE family transcriptional regulator [Variovorax sp.]